MLQTIVSTAAILVLFALACVRGCFLAEQEEELEKLRQETRKCHLLALKCVITNPELDRQVRLDAYDEYKSLGGTGWVDTYVSDTLRAIKER
jgi:hypothetical protein